MAGKIFTGLGQAGNWADPNNWTVSPAVTDGALSLVTMSATMNGTFTAQKLMFLGQEQVAVNGALHTNSPGPCSSFMVCDGATATFSSAASLSDAGGIVVGNEAVGTLVANGTAAQHPVFSTVSLKVGRLADGVGSVTLNNATLNDSGNVYVGQYGQGSLTLSGGTASVGTSFVIGEAAGASGSVTLSDARLSIGGYTKVGGGDPTGVLGGTGSLTVGAGSVVTMAGPLGVSTPGSSLTMAGGSVAVTGAGDATSIWTSARLSGFGTFTSSAGGIVNGGVIQAAGGTLAVTGNITGAGQLQVAGGATLQLDAATLGAARIGFLGSGGTLDLLAGAADHAVITGFAAGDAIVMAGIDQVGFNASTDVLTLSGGGHVVDTLKLAGSYAGAQFTLTHVGNSAAIGLLPSHAG